MLGQALSREVRSASGVAAAARVSGTCRSGRRPEAAPGPEIDVARLSDELPMRMDGSSVDVLLTAKSDPRPQSPLLSGCSLAARKRVALCERLSRPIASLCDGVHRPMAEHHPMPCSAGLGQMEVPGCSHFGQVRWSSGGVLPTCIGTPAACACRGRNNSTLQSEPLQQLSAYLHLALTRHPKCHRSPLFAGIASPQRPLPSSRLGAPRTRLSGVSGRWPETPGEPRPPLHAPAPASPVNVRGFFSPPTLNRWSTQRPLPQEHIQASVFASRRPPAHPVPRPRSGRGSAPLCRIRLRGCRPGQVA